MPLTPYHSWAGITIYHGDCREIVPRLERGSVDLLLTDPPYGIGEARGKNKSRVQLAMPKDYGVSSWDDETCPEGVNAAIELARWSIVFGGNFYTLPPASCWLVWDKDNTGDFADCELAWTNLKKAVRRIKWRWNGMLQENMGRDKEQRFHPTQKPLAVMQWCIQQAPKDCQVVLDPFMGSGTTLRAAKDLGMRAVGIEASEEYCEIAVRRLSQGVLFGAEAT